MTANGCLWNLLYSLAVLVLAASILGLAGSARVVPRAFMPCG